MVIVAKLVCKINNRIVSIGTAAIGVAMLAKIEVPVLVAHNRRFELVACGCQFCDRRRPHIQMLTGCLRNRHARHLANDRSPQSRRANHILALNLATVSPDSGHARRLAVSG